MRGRAGSFLVLMLLFGRASPLAAQDVFQVNTYTPSRQGNPAIAADGAGGFVVVWQSTDQDGDYYGIFGQRYAAAGTSVGSEFQVNQYVFGAQEAPAVAVLNGGGFVVVWDGYGEGGDYGDIFARRFDADGAPIGSEFQVNPAATAYEVAAAVAATADGGFVVVWDDFDDVFARRYDADAAPLADAVRVNASPGGTQAGAALAALPAGGFVVAWGDGYYLSNGQDGFGYGVFGRRFDSGGQPLGTEFQINTMTVGDQYGPAIAALSDGGFVVVWESFGHVGSEAAIFGRRFDSAGARVGTEFMVDSTTVDYEEDAAVASSADGRFVVTWVRSPPPATAGSSAVLVRRFDSDGMPVGGAEALQPTAATDQEEPAVDALASGDFVVAWRGDEFDGSDGAVVARLVDATPGTASPTAEPSATPAASPTASPSPILPTAAASSSATPSRTAPSTATATPTVSSGTDTPTSTRSPSATATVEMPSGTATASRTPSAPPTTTPTEEPSATAPATATPPAPACPGDCNGNGAVTVDDLILGVNIALGIQPLSRCPVADRDGDGQVGVSELIAAVNRALNGCA